jgi:steroid 5-alpha reductase family enzyme
MNSSFLDRVAIAGLTILGLMALLWLLSLRLKDASIVDPFWGSGLVITGWLHFSLAPDGYDGRNWLPMIFVTIWGLRPSLYLLWRNWPKGEGYRYQKWRQDEGDRWWWYSFFKAFLLQGLSTRTNCSPVGCGATRAPPQLLRGCRPVVGLLPAGSGCRRLVSPEVADAGT